MGHQALLGRRYGGSTRYYEVVNLTDDQTIGSGSLRDCMTRANWDRTPSVITFAPNLSGTILIDRNLPNIADFLGATRLEGQTLSDGTPKVTIANVTGTSSSLFRS